MAMSENRTVPAHVGLIMDGNGRWAQARGLSRTQGHTKGMINMIRLSEHAFALGAKTVTCYSLSTENLNRSPEELGHILQLVLEYEQPFFEAFSQLHVHVRFVGELDLLPLHIRQSLQRTEERLAATAQGDKTLYVAIAYGGTAEIVNAVNAAVQSGRSVTQESFLSDLQLPFMLDLVIRTGGERRLSNFFMYQCAYAELFFSDVYFPDFSEQDLQDAFDWYAGRSRRYGLQG